MRFAQLMCTGQTVLIASLASSIALAGDGAAQLRETETQIEATSLSDTARRKSAAWNLNESEWHRYEELMQGIRGSVSATALSPIEVLGIHARDDAERRRYAERWARAMYEDAERILAFQRAYDTAVRQLVGDQRLIDTNRYPEDQAAATMFTDRDRLLLFVRTECPACDAVVTKVLSHSDRVAGIDIYLTDADELTERDIRQWAREQSIDAGWVRSRRVTLNRDDGVLRSINRKAAEPPLVFLRRDDQTRAVSYAEL